jgi:predicted TPR repeat methyltransferase
MGLSYVQALFDQYADRFDAALGRLDYRGPQLLRTAVEQVCGELRRPPHFGSMLDLGCGTGLAGAAFRPLVDWLIGVDLSSGMIAQARGKGLYDRLEVGEIAAFLAAEAQVGARHHLIAAADVFAYLHDLAPVLRGAASVLAAGGLLTFTVETHDGEGVLLGPSLRYAHGEAIVRAALADVGLALLRLTDAAIRTEAGAPVPGLVVVAGTSTAAG